ncbi:addiction module protein [candidate division KSB1 bacterium]|nr:addiction module protein [candidate division KSB1 bacterium]NIR71881.1 addiction module protein [candidate division KSB1 bacterium]NIS26448.1 addiction module protein [candidate division KSB1 bacterium]NIT73218.1 addiction module protein [candidate division KSB1 bacterium]NIU27132.1 addiction module protein [candidate division KSB1 bacterium]
MKEIEEQALLLPPQDREVLIQRLVNSLDNAPLTDVDEAWIEEAEKRYKEYKEGTTQGIPGEKIFAEIRRDLGWES